MNILKRVIFVLLGSVFCEFSLFASEDRVDLKPLEKYEDIPDRTGAREAKPLEAAQKDAKVFFFKSVDLQGCTVLSRKVQDRLVKPYLRKKLCLNDINDLIAAVHKAYADAGYVLEDVYFKRESFKKSGYLVVFLVEPKVRSLRIFESKKRGRRVNNLMELKPNEVLKVVDVQCALDTLKELEATAYDFRLNTDAKRTWHTADVALKRNKKCIFGLGYDNQGSESTGRDRYTVQARAEDVLGLFEQWRFLHMTTRKPFSKERYSQTSLVSLSVPYRRWRASFYGIFEKDKHLLRNLSSKTEQVQLGADLRYALSRTWDSGTYVGSTLEHYSKIYSLDNHWIGARSGDATKLILWGSHYVYVWGGVIWGKLSYSQGIHASDAWTTNEAFNKNFKKLNFDGFFQRKFGERWRWIISGEAQVGEPRIFNHEKFSLGGMSTVRGFVDTQYKACSGYFVRNELEYLLFNKFSTKFFVGYDYGRLSPSKEDDALREKSLQSICCGVRLNVKDVNVEMLMARPIHTVQSNRYTFLFGIKGEF